MFVTLFLADYSAWILDKWLIDKAAAFFERQVHGWELTGKIDPRTPK